MIAATVSPVINCNDGFNGGCEDVCIPGPPASCQCATVGLVVSATNRRTCVGAFTVLFARSCLFVCLFVVVVVVGLFNRMCALWRHLKVKAEHLYSALHGIQTTLKRLGMDHTVLPATNTMPALPHKRSPDGDSTD